MPDSKTTIIPSGPPADYRPKRGGKRQEYWPEVTVRLELNPEATAYYKARMDEVIAARRAERGGKK